MERVRAVQFAREAKKIREALPIPGIVHLNGQDFRVIQLENGTIRLIRV
jgi:hypothetical protein